MKASFCCCCFSEHERLLAPRELNNQVFLPEEPRGSSTGSEVSARILRDRIWEVSASPAGVQVAFMLPSFIHSPAFGPSVTQLTFIIPAFGSACGSRSPERSSRGLGIIMKEESLWLLAVCSFKWKPGDKSFQVCSSSGLRTMWLWVLGPAQVPGSDSG